MRRRDVSLSPEAESDLLTIEAGLLEAASSRTADAFISRLLAAIRSLETASERGRPRFELLPGLRVLGFERRLAIIFVVHEDAFEVQRIYYAGRDWERDFQA